MLYQLKSRTTAATLAGQVLGAIAGLFAGIARTRSDGAYLDGMRGTELEDLGLRRSEDGGYRSFE
jgi:hypothetical protein